MPKWKAVFVALDDFIGEINQYEQNEFDKTDEIWERMTYDDKWKTEDPIEYTGHYDCRHENHIARKWEPNVKSFIDDLKVNNQGKTLLYLSDHIPSIASPAPTYLQFSDTQVTAAILAPHLPNGSDQDHIVIISGGSSGKFADQLIKEIENLDLKSITVISTTGKDTQPPGLDNFRIERGMSNTDDFRVAFMNERINVPEQDPYMWVGPKN